MASTFYNSYDMFGIKEEFANWVSNISPEDTPFSSMIGKFPVKNITFQWQTDNLGVVDTGNSYTEASDAAATATAQYTKVLSNVTQIMRKVVVVSDTANAVSSYGREKEVFYQLKKAAKELKRDQESIFLLEAQDRRDDNGVDGRLTKSFGFQIDATNKFATAANNTDFEAQLFALTAKLYTEGADANIIMFHPGQAELFADLQETTSGSRNRIFENDKRFIKQVETITDPLGQTFKCVPNRWLPDGVAYVFSPSDVAIAVLRAPKQIKLNKTGSAEKYMIEQEVGLRLNNPLAAGVLKTQ